MATDIHSPHFFCISLSYQKFKACAQPAASGVGGGDNEDDMVLSGPARPKSNREGRASGSLGPTLAWAYSSESVGRSGESAITGGRPALRPVGGSVSAHRISAIFVLGCVNVTLLAAQISVGICRLRPVGRRCV